MKRFFTFFVFTFTIGLLSYGIPEASYGQAVPSTGTILFIQKPHELPLNNFTIAPGEFAVFVHNGQQHAIIGQRDFQTYSSYYTVGNDGNPDFPNLARFFANGGRIELISHATVNPLPPDTHEPQFGDVVISEILWGLDGSSPAKQYIELYNASQHTYTFAHGDFHFRFSQTSEAPLPDGIYPASFNPDAAQKVIDRVSNKGWKVPGHSGSIARGLPLRSMYRMINYTTGHVPEGTLASSWRGSAGSVNLPPPNYGTPGTEHQPTPIVLDDAPVDELNLLDAGPKIEGPWVWMIAPTGGNSGSRAASSGRDWLAAASGGSVTERHIATNGATPGVPVGNKVWTLGKLAPTGSNNIAQMMNAIGLGSGNYIEYHVAYGSLALNSPRKQNTKMYVGSDDAVKVWLNGVLVHNNPADRPARDYQDEFSVTLKQGRNILLVAVYNGEIDWTGFFGFENDAVYSLAPTSVVHVSPAERPPMYWIDTQIGTLHRLIGNKVENIVPHVRNVTSLAVDAAGGKLYWTEKTGERTGRIRRANLNGNPNVQLVKNLTSVPYGIALDPANGKMYLTNAWGKIQRMNVDGSNFQPNLITGLDAPKSLTVDVSGGKVYWTEGTGRIRRANLDGSKVETVAAGLATPMDIAIFGNTLYWAEKLDENRGEIRYANLNGNPDVGIHVTFRQSFPVGIAVDAVERTLYWTTSLGAIGRSSLDGSTPLQNIVTGLGAPAILAVQVEAPEIPERLATDAVVRIAPSPVTSPGIGEQLTLNLNITAGEAVAGYQVTVGFDATALRYVESDNGTYLPTGAFFVPPVVDRGRLELAATALTGVSSGNGTLATITFEVIAVKASTLSVSESLLADSQGNTLHPRVADGEVTEPPELTADVNRDGMVNIQDLVLVASTFGKTGQNSADVNGDGVVNIADLVLVAGALGNVAAAPKAYADSLEQLTTEEVRQWVTEARLTAENSLIYRRGILMLEHLLRTLTPKATALLPNYPNPFNPETWIPYHLAKPADVTLRIYATDGRLVRTLELGYQPVGNYESRSRAAHWDGKNALGEPVASGVYFYTLSDGDFTATRKMLIRK